MKKMKRTEEKRENNKGITLVALVVTIIILLILAGVTIYFAVNGGLLGKVEEAVNKSNEAGQNEANVLDQATAEIDKYLNGTGGSTPPEVSLINIEYDFDKSTGTITGIKNKANYYEGGWDGQEGHAGVGDCILPGGDTVIIPSQIDGVAVRKVGAGLSGLWLFCGCSNVKTVIIPEGVTTLAAVSFFGCKNLTTITIPNSVTSIGGSCFESTSLTTVNYTGSQEQWNAITKDSGNTLLLNANIIYNYGK